jgi:NAD(P)-dependent dehydrogenase (short-subunit alcohol dehydrogenase family)
MVRAAVDTYGGLDCAINNAVLALGRGGAIVGVGSGHEHGAALGVPWYLSAKQGKYGMTKVAALEYGGRGIRINAIGPGSMWSPRRRYGCARPQPPTCTDTPW